MRPNNFFDLVSRPPPSFADARITSSKVDPSNTSSGEKYEVKGSSHGKVHSRTSVGRRRRRISIGKPEALASTSQSGDPNAGSGSKNKRRATSSSSDEELRKYLRGANQLVYSTDDVTGLASYKSADEETVLKTEIQDENFDTRFEDDVTDRSWPYGEVQPVKTEAIVSDRSSVNDTRSLESIMDNPGSSHTKDRLKGEARRLKLERQPAESVKLGEVGSEQVSSKSFGVAVEDFGPFNDSDLEGDDVGGLLNNDADQVTSSERRRCSECPQEFFSPFLLDMHQKAAHEGASGLHCRESDGVTEEQPESGEQQTGNEHPGTISTSKPKLKTIFQCRFCPKEFNFKNHFTVHTRTIHEFPTTCHLCLIKFHSKIRLKQHLKAAHKRITPRCLICEKDYRNESVLKFHYWSLHYQKLTNDQLKIDEQDTNREKTFKCQLCPRKFQNKHEEMLHTKEIHQFPTTCHICLIKFLSKRKHEQHFNEVHKKMTNCLVCKRECRNVSKLKRHYWSRHLEHLTDDQLKIDEEESDNDQLKTVVSSKRKANIIFKCNFCPKEVKSIQLMKVHTKTVHEFPTTCHICLIKFKSKRRYEQHFKVTHKSTTLCFVCKKEFRYESDLKFHCWSRHLEHLTDDQLKINDEESEDEDTKKVVPSKRKARKCFKCNFCPQEYKTKKGSTVHSKTVHEFPTTCYVCLIKFKSKRILKQHLLLTHKNFSECSVCKKDYRNELALRYHCWSSHLENLTEDQLIVDEKEEEYLTAAADRPPRSINEATNSGIEKECLICHQKFSNAYFLTNHMESVHNMADLQCNICKKVSKNSYILEQHILHVHEKVRKYSCPLCDRKFSRKNSFETHLTVQHEKRRLFRCHYCSQEFSQRSLLIVHVKGVHEAPLDCHFCRQKFDTKLLLLDHLKDVHKNSTVCNICEKDFKLVAWVKRHMYLCHFK